MENKIKISGTKQLTVKSVRISSQHCHKQNMNKDKISQSTAPRCLAARVVYVFFILAYFRPDFAAIYSFILKAFLIHCLQFLTLRTAMAGRKTKRSFMQEVLKSTLQHAQRKGNLMDTASTKGVEISRNKTCGGVSCHYRVTII